MLGFFRAALSFFLPLQALGSLSSSREFFSPYDGPLQPPPPPPPPCSRPMEAGIMTTTTTTTTTIGGDPCCCLSLSRSCSAWPWQFSESQRCRSNLPPSLRDYAGSCACHITQSATPDLCAVRFFQRPASPSQQLPLLSEMFSPFAITAQSGGTWPHLPSTFSGSCARRTYAQLRHS